MKRRVDIGTEKWLAHVTHGMVNTIAVALLFSFAAPEAWGPDQAQASTGSVCIARLLPPDPHLLPVLPPTSKPDASSSVKIDDRPRQVLSDHSASLVPDLAIDKKHLVRIFAGDKQIESFWFRFSQFQSRRLCLIKDNFYGTWRLWEAKDHGADCRCPEA